MEDKILVFTEANYADEFDIYGFEIIDRKRWETFLEKAEEFLSGEESSSMELYFGTNESILFEDMRDVEDFFSIKEITEEEYAVIKKLFGEDYGHSLFTNFEENIVDLED